MAYELPKVFQEKIKVDKQVSAMRNASVVSLAEYKDKVDEQFRVKQGCEAFIQRQRGGPNA